MQQGFNLLRWARRAVRKIIIFFSIIYSYFPVNLRKTILYYYKKKEFPLKEPTIFYCFDSHWNSAESFLPVLYWLKERMGYRIIVFWGAEDEQRIIRGNEFFFNMLINVSDVLVLNGFIPSAGISRTDRFEQILLIARDIFYCTLMKYGLRREYVAFFKKYNVVSVLQTSDANEIFGWLKECFPLARHILHPHAFSGMYNLPDADWVSCYKQKCDIITWTDDYCLSGFSRVLERNAYENLKKRLVIVGNPRYDEWWLEKVAAFNKQIDFFKKEIFAQKGKKIIIICLGRLTMLNPVMKVPLDEQEVTDRELSELSKFFSVYQSFDMFYVFKFHPSTVLYHVDLDIFFQKVVPQSQFEYQITSLPMAAIARYADLVISVGQSSVAMDSAAVGIPTIEFHEKRAQEYWYECSDGTYGSFLKLHQLALYASNAQELCHEVDLVLGEKIVWDVYFKKLQKYLLLDGCASKRFGDIVQQYAKSSK